MNSLYQSFRTSKDIFRSLHKSTTRWKYNQESSLNSGHHEYFYYIDHQGQVRLLELYWIILKGFSHSFEKTEKTILNESKPTKYHFLLKKVTWLQYWTNYWIKHLVLWSSWFSWRPPFSLNVFILKFEPNRVGS